MAEMKKVDGKIINLPSLPTKYQDRRPMIQKLESLISQAEEQNLAYTSYFLNMAIDSLLNVD